MRGGCACCLSVSVSVSACVLSVLCVGIARRTVTVMLDEIVRIVMEATVNEQAIRRVKI